MTEKKGIMDAGNPGETAYDNAKTAYDALKTTKETKEGELETAKEAVNTLVQEKGADEKWAVEKQLVLATGKIDAA
jgi:hypothetical protein